MGDNCEELMDVPVGTEVIVTGDSVWGAQALGNAVAFEIPDYFQALFPQ